MSVTYIDAIHQAMAELLAEDEKVFLYGEDIAGKFGGAFKATKGLAEQFPGRVINSPIAEDAIMGMAIGAALGGMKPIVEMQFADFGTLAQNQLGNNAAAHYYRTGIPVNVTSPRSYGTFTFPRMVATDDVVLSITGTLSADTLSALRDRLCDALPGMIEDILAEQDT